MPTLHRCALAGRRALPAVLALVAALGATAAASGPTFWTLATAADFLKGTSDGVYVSLSGVLTAGPQLTSRLASSPAQVWSLAQAADGTLWAGTGGDGRVIRLRPGGRAEETVFDSEENNVFALAVSGSRLYAATGPDGKVYAIESDGTVRPFFDPEEKYIWALAVDGTGRLWVGAGNPAVIYRVDAAGTSQVIYKPPAAHVVALTRDSTGRMLAGTESPGRLYRFDAADRPFVLLDAGATELRAIMTDPSGVVFAAAVTRGDDSSSEPASVAATLAAPATSSSSASSGSTASSSSVRRSALYRIEPTGTWEEIWGTNDLIYDLAQGPGGVLVATGPEGRLYQVDRNRDVYLLTGVDAKQITRFAFGSGGALSAFATSNPGRVVAVGSGEQSPATFTSPVRDSKSVATWGLIRWNATAPVSLYTRSGNTEKPDDSWSPWSSAYNKGDGETVTSPAARFLQWKAVFTKPGAPPSAQLTAVTVAYLARNARPEVASVTVYPPGVVFQRPYSSEEGAIAGLDDATADARRAPGDPGPTAPAPGRRMLQKGLQTITWKGDDDDSDHLSYALQYRREGETTWRDLKTGLSDGIYVWDTTTVADGRYIIRVVASDSPSNAGDRALNGERESDAMDVDNTPPTAVSEVTRQGAAVRLIVRVHDAKSPIQKLEYSTAGSPWQLVYPADGLADSPDERYEIPLANEAEAARILLRATDLLQNVLSQTAVSR